MNTQKISSSRMPFDPAAQLCGELMIELLPNGQRQVRAISSDQQWLPSQPSIPLVATREVTSHLKDEFLTPRLDKMSPYLWLVATQSSSHISALNDQIVRGRNVAISEKPELHLVWYDNRIFLKPIPPYLLSYDFWRFYFSDESISTSNVGQITPFASSEEKDRVLRSVQGYLRSYYYLIRHESDFRIAKEAHLIPPEISFSKFVAFMGGFVDIADEDVSLRYSFGELRLSRLNLWAKILLGQWQFQKVCWHYSDFFARLFAPILFIFGLLSVTLSAMQVGAQVRPAWDAFAAVSAWFSVIILLVVAVLVLGLGGLAAFMLCRELIYALKYKVKKGKKPRRKSSSG